MLRGVGVYTVRSTVRVYVGYSTMITLGLRYNTIWLYTGDGDREPTMIGTGIVYRREMQTSVVSVALTLASLRVLTNSLA